MNIDFWAETQVLIEEHEEDLTDSFIDFGYIEITSSNGNVFRSVSDHNGTFFINVATWKTVGHYSNIKDPGLVAKWVSHS